MHTLIWLNLLYAFVYTITVLYIGYCIMQINIFQLFSYKVWNRKKSHLYTWILATVILSWCWTLWTLDNDFIVLVFERTSYNVIGLQKVFFWSSTTKMGANSNRGAEGVRIFPGLFFLNFSYKIVQSAHRVFKFKEYLAVSKAPLKPGFHYPSWRPVNSSSGNRA